MPSGKKCINLIGQNFDRLIVKTRAARDNRGGVYWNCLCECGEEVERRTQSLLLGYSKSCGCHKLNYKIGDKINKLTIIKKLGTIKKGRNKNIYWECECDCGNRTEVNTSTLNIGIIQSCGCAVKDFNRITHEKVGEIRWWFWQCIVRSGGSRQLEFNITPEYIWSLWEKQKGRCAISNLVITLPKESRNRSTSSASLDRINSSKGYIKNNVWWVHKDINIMKNKFSMDYFISLCEHIYKHKQGMKHET